MPMALKQAHMVWCSSVLQTNFPNQYFLLVFNWKYLYTRYTIAQKFGDGKIFEKKDLMLTHYICLDKNTVILWNIITI